MALSIEKLLGDAQILVARLRDHDSTADILIAHTQTLHKRLDAMKQVMIFKSSFKTGKEQYWTYRFWIKIMEYYMRAYIGKIDKPTNYI